MSLSQPHLSVKGIPTSRGPSLATHGVHAEDGHYLMGNAVSYDVWVGSAQGEEPETGIFAGEKREQLMYEMNCFTSLA